MQNKIVHTFELEKLIDYDCYLKIDNILFRATKTTPHREYINTLWYSMEIRTYKLIPECPVELRTEIFMPDEFSWTYSFVMRINPAKIIYRDYINASDIETARSVEFPINNMFENLRINFRYKDFKLKRIDYTRDYKFESKELAEKYLKLIKKSDIPDGFELYTKPSLTGHRVVPPKSSYYCKNSRVKINIYDRYEKMKHELLENGTYEGIDMTEVLGIIRFEIQCEKIKVRTIGDTYNLPDRDIDQYLVEEISAETIKSYLKKVCCTGDFTTYKNAINAINESKIRPENIALMIRFLELVNKKRKGVHDSKLKLLAEGYSKSEISDMLQRFNSLNINPVTIPESWEIDKLDNPIKLLFK